MLKNASFAIILNDKNQVLLILRDDVPVWNLPGGGVEEGEDFEEALHREMEEEICTEVDIVRQLGNYTYKDSRGNDLVIRSYFCKIKGKKPELGAEGICLKYFDLDDLPKNLVPKQKGRLDDFVKFSDFVERIQFEGSTSDLLTDIKQEEIIGWEMWKQHPLVLKNKDEGRLRFDINKFD